VLAAFDDDSASVEQLGSAIASAKSDFAKFLKAQVDTEGYIGRVNALLTLVEQKATTRNADQLAEQQLRVVDDRLGERERAEE
jgi:hypothetical protein